MKPLYPNIKIKMVGEDGNAFAILGRTVGAMRRANVSQEVIDQYLTEAKSGDYDKLIQTTIKYVDVD